MLFLVALAGALSAQSFETPARGFFGEPPQADTAQPAPPTAPSRPEITYTVSHQPLEVFRAVFSGQRIDRVGLYEVTVCNHTGEQRSVGGGLIVEKVTAQKMPVINRALLSHVAGRAQGRTKLYKIAKVAEWGAWAAAIALAGGSSDASAITKLIPPLIAGASGRLASTLEQTNDQLEILAPVFLDAEKQIMLGPHGCGARLFLATFAHASPKTFGGAVW